MSNSPLVSYTRISPNKTSPRTHKIDTITIHCTAGQCTVETLGSIFAPKSRRASCNYGVAKDGKIGMYCEEKDRSWCSSDSDNDNRAITIEVSSDSYHPYRITEAAYDSLINLLVDICQRNGITKLLWKADKSLIGNVSQQNMTVHRWFANKACPGDYLYNLHSQIADEVNSRLLDKVDRSSLDFDDIEVGSIYKFSGNTQYVSSSSNEGIKATADRVRVTSKYKSSAKHPIHARAVDKEGNYISGVYGWIDVSSIEFLEMSPYIVRVVADALNYRTGPSTSYKVVGTIRDRGLYTIVEEKDGWGKLKSKLGWISLKYTQKV